MRAHVHVRDEWEEQEAVVSSVGLAVVEIAVADIAVADIAAVGIAAVGIVAAGTVVAVVEIAAAAAGTAVVETVADKVVETDAQKRQRKRERVVSRSAQGFVPCIVNNIFPRGTRFRHDDDPSWLALEKVGESTGRLVSHLGHSPRQ